MKRTVFFSLLKIAESELILRHNADSPVNVIPGMKNAFGNKSIQREILTVSAETGLSGLLLSALSRCYPGKETNKLRKWLYNTFPAIHHRDCIDLFLYSELERISKAFAIKNCKVVVLKGPVTAKTIYGSSGMRNHIDLDILISPDKLTEGEEILADCLYSKVKHAEAENLDEFHHLLFERTLPSGITCQVELHIRLKSSRYGGQSLEWEDVRCLAEKTDTPFVHFRFNQNALMAHALMEAYEDGGSLRHLVDVLAMTIAFEQDTSQNDCIHRWQLTRAQAYTNHILAGDAPSSMIPPWWLFDPKATLSLRLLAGHYIMGGFAIAVRYFLFWGLFPPKAVMARRTGLRKDSFLLTAAYLIAPLITLLHFAGSLISRHRRSSSSNNKRSLRQ